MNILIIDDDELVLELLHHYLDEEFPEAQVTEYPALKRGRPGPEFDWSCYDVLLIDNHLGPDETGVDWLHAFGSLPGFPQSILISSVDDPHEVRRFIQVGAQSYINKADLSPRRLALTIRDVLSGNSTDKTVEIVPPATLPMNQDVAGNSEPEVPQQLRASVSQYNFGQLIGRGGMGSVYIAERVEDGTTVVVKVLKHVSLDDKTILHRFIQEGKVITNLDSPYVVKIFEHGYTENYTYIAMEYFGQGDLKQRIAHGVSADVATEYLYNIARGLALIHEVGIVHRDLKPANIMFRSDGSMALADFGIAKQIGMSLGLTLAGSIVGTPNYMSPEQANGAPIDSRFDIYSAGAIFYELLTGTTPYHGASISATVFQHMHAAVPTLEGPLACYQPLLNRLMAKDPNDRYQTASELCQILFSQGVGSGSGLPDSARGQ